MRRIFFLLCLLALPALAQSRQDVRTPAFHGRLYTAVSPKPLAILIIGGSEGHLLAAEGVAPDFNAAGYTVLGVDYHDGRDATGSSGRKLSLLPIETFTAAVAWLRALPGHPAVAVIGASRGSEAALLTGVYDHDVAAVAAFVPSSVLWRSFGTDPGQHRPAWTWQGKPLACVSCEGGRGGFDMMLDETPKDSPARIPVEQIQAPLFLAGSDGDGLWPSGRMTRELAARLKAHDFAYPLTVVIYPAANHRLLGPRPLGPRFDPKLGGTPEGTNDARQKSWVALLGFLATVERIPSSDH